MSRDGITHIPDFQVQYCHLDESIPKSYISTDQWVYTPLNFVHIGQSGKERSHDKQVNHLPLRREGTGDADQINIGC